MLRAIKCIIVPSVLCFCQVNGVLKAIWFAIFTYLQILGSAFRSVDSFYSWTYNEIVSTDFIEKHKLCKAECIKN